MVRPGRRAPGGDALTAGDRPAADRLAATSVLDVPAAMVTVPNGRIAVRDVGGGPVVVLVHGGTSTGRHEWDTVATHLAPRHRIVAVDVRGHGESTHEGGAFGVRRFAADLVSVLDARGVDQADLVGFSMGANTVLRLLTIAPGRARRAVVVGGSATGDPDRIRSFMATDAWPRSLRALRHQVDPSPDYWRRLRDRLVTDWADDPAIDEADLARVECPVLVVAGSDDPLQPDGIASHLAGALPRGRLVVVPGAGHAVHVDRPATFLALLDDFLTAPPATAPPATAPPATAPHSTAPPATSPPATGARP